MIVSASVFLIGAGCISRVAHAAVVNVAVDNAVITQNQDVRVSVTLDTQGADANTVQAEVTFPSGLFTVQKIMDGNSAISLWVSPPKQSSPGVIDIAGIMPGGVIGADESLFSFELQPTGVGTGTIQVATATVLANDGLGSSLPVALGSLSVSVSPALTSSTLSAPVIDYLPPNSFTPQIESDPNIFNGRYFLVFSTTDSGSGIDHYEVLEVPNGSSQKPFSAWQVAASPYVLTDQDLSSDIYVRAVDHSGNFIVVKVPARHPYAHGNYWGALAAAIVIVLVVSLLVWARRRRRDI